mmetsp:Transcript_22307/g.38286  ORF Transcript_22307/g.38286 Transcript_22307/m.38286 type:complete len:122 (-) Transcript_22307:189-554(-)
MFCFYRLATVSREMFCNSLLDQKTLRTSMRDGAGLPGPSCIDRLMCVILPLFVRILFQHGWQWQVVFIRILWAVYTLCGDDYDDNEEGYMIVPMSIGKEDTEHHDGSSDNGCSTQGLPMEY